MVLLGIVPSRRGSKGNDMMRPHECEVLKQAGDGNPSHVAHTLEPLAVPLSRAPAVTGLSRSTIYREAAKGNLRLLKSGRATLLCMQSARTFLANLPTANIRRPRQAA